MNSIKNVINFSKNNIIWAKKVLADNNFAKSEGRRIYYRDARGMYRALQKEARQLLKACEVEKISLEKPYKLIRVDGRCVIFGAMGNNIVPLR